MAEELKACPFCGGPMTLKISRSNGHQIFGSHTKECAFSDISACMQEPSDCEWVADEIIKRWNTRAQLPSQGGEAVMWVNPNVIGADMKINWPTAITFSNRGPCHNWTLPLYTHQATPPDSRVVPVELLERIAKPFEPGVSSSDHVVAVRELRALLEAKP